MGKMKTKGLAQEEKNTGQNVIQKTRINFALTMNVLIDMFVKKNGILRKPMNSCKKKSVFSQWSMKSVANALLFYYFCTIHLMNIV